jgi:hypothetical protein
MDQIEALFYAILYGYVIVGFFYLMRMELRDFLSSDLKLNNVHNNLIEIGIREKNSMNLDVYLSSLDIYQMEKSNRL